MVTWWRSPSRQRRSIRPQAACGAPQIVADTKLPAKSWVKGIASTL
jgi:hypothetical protein